MFGNISTLALDPWVAARYGSLVLPLVLHQLENNYRKHLPKYNGEKGSAKDHLIAFQDFTDDYNIEQA